MTKIEVKQLTKTYGDTVALDNVGLTLDEEKIYGLLGRNGAGKTTLLNAITSKIHPTQGNITVNGERVWENDRVLGKIFYMTELNLYQGSLRVREAFKWTAEFYPEFDKAYAEALADRFELNTRKRIKELSTGYASIFKAILTLASGARILLFDEPVLGLDAYHRELLYKEILSNYIAQPKTVVISTHLIDEVADLLEEVIIMKTGRIILKQSVEELLASCYTVCGEASRIDEYIVGKMSVGHQTLQNFKSVIVVKGERNEALAKSLDLEFGKVELQKLFVGLTSA